MNLKIRFNPVLEIPPLKLHLVPTFDSAGGSGHFNIDVPDMKKVVYAVRPLYKILAANQHLKLAKNKADSSNRIILNEAASCFMNNT